MEKLIVHRCPCKCTYNKRCFICKTSEIKGEVVIFHKCKVTKEDIPILLGTSPSEDCVGG